MIEIEKPKIETVEANDEGTYGKFVVEPLERGYGTTLGNSLRRILLSSLPGAAVTSVQIDGVLHEFSTVPGVMEDVTEIILNLKALSLKIHSDEEKVFEIDAEGKASLPQVISVRTAMLRSSIRIFTLQRWDLVRDFICVFLQAVVAAMSKRTGTNVTISQLVLFQLTPSILQFHALTTA